jgi:hypothetical protein
MPINISKSLLKKLPSNEQDGLEEYLWSKSGSKCFLCEEPLNLAADSIEADHEIPESEGGPNTRDNLNLAHVTCNRAKRAAKSVDIRPYLKLAAYIRKHGGSVKYGDCYEHFGIDPLPIGLEMQDGVARLHLPDRAIVEAPIYLEPEDGGRFPYVFVELPRSAIFNDDDCQPRTIKLPQVYAIYGDIRRNPLHEPPGCRIVSAEKPNMCRVLMFDGQHKTIASWMQGRETVVVKLYLDITREQTIELVNSIQAKIKKLPLSPFELAAKMGEEWADKLAKYEEEVGTEAASEAGFISWLPQDQRGRGKAAFQAALVQNVLSAAELRFTAFVQRTGTKNENTYVPENAFKTKVLERMLSKDPLTEPASEAEVMRSRERDSVVRVLNMLTDRIYEVPEGATELTDAERERARRMSYQSALAYLAGLLRDIVSNVLAVSPDRAFLDREPTEAEWGKIEQAIEKVTTHPVWHADLDSTKKLGDLKTALQKNQDVQKIFPKLGLKLAYAVGVEQLDSDWAQ